MIVVDSVNYDEGLPADGQKVMLATTSYDNPDANYTFSIQQARKELGNTAYFLLRGNPHVDDARNEVVKTFLASDCSDLLFIDADVSFSPEALKQLIARDVSLVGGVYPYRKDVDGMPVRLVCEEPVEGLLEVEGLPTGFMKIKRRVFEEMASICPSYGDTTLYFERALIEGTRWGGDLNFCNRWRSLGGKVYADFELVLGHTGKVTFEDSLGAFLRRRAGTTLPHVVKKVREGLETPQDVQEAIRYVDNRWGADAMTLSVAIKVAREADGPIIEAGSGLSTILMAAATNQTVYCLEHSPVHYERLRDLSRQSGVTNIAIVACALKDGWYDIEKEDIPAHFSVGFNDGPPRKDGDRMKFFEHVTADVIVCDDAVRADLEGYAMRTNRRVEFAGDRTAIIR